MPIRSTVSSRMASWLFQIGFLLVVGLVCRSIIIDAGLARGKEGSEPNLAEGSIVTLYSPDLDELGCAIANFRAWSADLESHWGQEMQLLWPERLAIVTNSPNEAIYVALWCDGQPAPAWEVPNAPGPTLAIRFSDVRTAESIESFAYVAEPGN